MKYQQLVLLLPCQSLEDFPTSYEGDDAQGLLAAWSAVWHPALLAAVQSMPVWYRASSAPDAVANKLIVVPGVSSPELPSGYAQRAANHGAVVICERLQRQEIVEAALANLDGGDGGVEPGLAADFLALGYCYLQVQLLTRQMRYSSNLDELHFQKQLVTAATAAISGDPTTAREKLGVCFSLLAEERDHYYPVEAFLLDLTMLAPTTLGASLREELSQDRVVNLALPAELLAVLAANQPETLAALRQAAAEDRLGLLGGEYAQQRLPLVACETLLGELRRGLAQYEALLGRRPTVFVRRRFGLLPTLPQVLHKLGFEAALHATLEDGVFPEGSQIKIRWEGSDGTALDAVARPPADAAKPQTYLKLSLRMGESMDMDHVATLCLAHWPRQAAPWYDDLRRIAKYGSALGKFVTFDHYFRSTALSTQQQRFLADQYRSPYLRQAVAAGTADPISSSVRYWRRHAAAEATQTLRALASFITGHPSAAPEAPAELLVQVDAASEAGDVPGLDARLHEEQQAAVQQFADRLPRQSSLGRAGYLVVNPHSFVRRVGVEMPELPGLPTVARPIYAAAETARSKYVVVDVPPLGYAWIAPGAGPSAVARNEPPLAEECRLQNEFFEAIIDPTTGALRVFREHNSRTNRLSQQLAFRWPNKAQRDADSADSYSRMACEEVKTTLATLAVGEIVARGRLVDRRGAALAGFRQTYRVWRGSRVLQVAIELHPQTECTAEPWESYFAARFAWANEAAELHRGLNQTRQPATAKRLEAPQYLEITDGDQHTTILTCGLPFHRREGGRMLDTLLLVPGERCREFQFGLGFDLKQPQQDADGLLAPPILLAQTAPPPAPSSSSWLFHIDTRNVLATHWEPLVSNGGVTGFRVRLLEIAGRSAQAHLSAFRPVVSARQVNFQGHTLASCTLAEGRVQVQMGAHEWQEIEAVW